MKKIVKIGNKEYTMQASAYTQFLYRNNTGRKYMQDLKQIANTKMENDDILETLDQLDDFTEIIFKIAFTMIQEADSKQVTSFADFLKSIDSVFDDTTWVNDTIELAMTPLSGGNKTAPQ